MLGNAVLYVFIAAGAVFLLLVFGLILARLYKRATKETSFVRTGFRGQKVIMNGGALVFPVLHEIIPVNMNTLRLEVQRGETAALITRDRMRVDVRAEFYVRVKPTAEAIADAAQTLGRRTMDPEALKDLVECKFVDALRAVAAEMSMEELHEKRVDFVQKVQTAVAEDLLKNGLELETVSLTALDQTDQNHFNPQNAFDAQGLTRLTEEIESRRKQRNDIEQETEVQIRTKNLEAERKKLALQRDEDYARMEQEREVAVRKAEEASATAREEALKEQEAEEARIASKQKVDQAGIFSERAVEQERIEKERMLKEKDITRQRSIETAEIERRQTVELADQERAIAIAEKSKEQSQSQAEADKARAVAARAEEQVTTAREQEKAERAKAIELVKASEQAEREAIGVRVAAEAEKTAAEDQADAVRILAQGEADKVRTAAEAQARQYEVEAAGKQQMNEAENTLNPELIAMQVKMATINNLDSIIRESVKPMQQIEGIKIYHVDGLGGGHGSGSQNGDGAAGHGAGSGNLADQLVSSALRYRGQAPLVDSLLSEIGLSGSNLDGLTAGLHGSTGSTVTADAAVPSVAAASSPSGTSGTSTPTIDGEAAAAPKN